MVTFQVNHNTFPGRLEAAYWNASQQETAWQLWEYPSLDGWKGVPVKFISAGDWRLWFIGETFGSSELYSASSSDLPEFISLQKEIHKLNGHYLVWAWHGEMRQWHIWTNRFGTLHAYYAFDGQRAAIGTFFPAVAAAASRRQLDWSALTSQFAFGFISQDRTHFKDVQILRPASHYVFDQNGRLIRQKRYWHWWHEPNRQRSYNDTVAEFGEILNEVLTDHTRTGRIAIPISGGLDSRTTVAAITQHHQATKDIERLWSYSYGYTDHSVETRIARQVATARGLTFQAYTIQPYLFDNLDLVLARTEGFQDITQARQMFVIDHIASHADYLIAALWGDVWLDDMGLAGKVSNEEPTVEGQATEDWIADYASHKMKKNGRAWLLEHLCRARLGNEQPEALLRKMVYAEMAKVVHIQEPDFRVKAFKTEQWSFRWSLPPIRVFQAGAFPRLTFYDTRLTDFFCTVPSEFVSQRRLQIDYLKRFAPDLARITWQVYDTNLFRYQYFNSWLWPKRALKKAWRIATRQKIIERNWEVQFLSETGRQGLINNLLRPGLRLHEFVSPSAVRLLLDDFYMKPSAQQGYTISMLLTFSTWLERYGE